MSARLAPLLLLALTLAACGAKVEQTHTVIDAPPKPRVVRFVAFGDAGSGSPQQIAIGQAMADVCAARQCDFALELGDNVYDSGVGSPDDPLFDTAFEIPYAPLNRMRIPIYLALGNHDNSTPGPADRQGNHFPGDGAVNSRGDHQVAYDKRTDRPSKMWRMPARYYRFPAPPPGFAEKPLAEFFALDSSPVTHYREDPDPRWNPETYAEEQREWLRKGLKESGARWRIVFAHHPYVSNGVHGNAGSFDAELTRRDRTKESKYASGKLWKKLLDESVCSYAAELFLSGHDHDLQWLRPVNDCGPTEFIVSGGGEGGAKRRKLGRANRNPARWQQDALGGFFWVELTEDFMKIAAFTVADNGQLVRDSELRPVPAFEQTRGHPRMMCVSEPC